MAAIVTCSVCGKRVGTYPNGKMGDHATNAGLLCAGSQTTEVEPDVDAENARLDREANERVDAAEYEAERARETPAERDERDEREAVRAMTTPSADNSKPRERIGLHEPAEWKVEDLAVPGFPFKVSRSDVSNILCSAFEGGSNYWVRKVRIVSGGGCVTWASQVPSAGGTLRLSYDDPLFDEGNGKGRANLDVAGVLLGISRALRWQDGKRFSMSHVNGDDQDAETADVILQFAILGDVVYG